MSEHSTRLGWVWGQAVGTVSKGGGARYLLGFRLIRIQVGEAIRPVWSKHMQLDVQNVRDLASLVRVALRAREGCRGKRLSQRGLVLRWEVLWCCEVTVHFWINAMWDVFFYKGTFTQAACLKCRHLRSMARDSDPGVFKWGPYISLLNKHPSWIWCRWFMHQIWGNTI